MNAMKSTLKNFSNTSALSATILLVTTDQSFFERAMYEKFHPETAALFFHGG
jgi:hypothetical protein